VQVFVPGLIVSLAKLSAVCLAIDLNDQAGMQASEINIVGAELDLFSKVVAIGAQGKDQPPKGTFGYS
jgi:hypothetical protein